MYISSCKKKISRKSTQNCLNSSYNGSVGVNVVFDSVSSMNEAIIFAMLCYYYFSCCTSMLDNPAVTARFLNRVKMSMRHLFK